MTVMMMDVQPRDGKKTRPWGYLRVIPTMGWVRRDSFALRVMGMEILNTRMSNEVGVRITVPVPADTQYEISILPFYIYI